MTALEDCVAGQISPQVAVARMLLAGLDAAGIRRALDEALDTAGPHPAVNAMQELVEGRTATLDALAAEVTATCAAHDASGPTPAEGIARIAGFFDHAVRHSPEASVALFSLGDPSILAAATAEILDWLDAEGLLPLDADVLDVGCGIGRVAAALAPRCRSVLGLDVSAGMVDEARRRLACWNNVQVRLTGGEHLDAVDPGTFDLVLAIDSFPYIVQTGPETALRHVLGAARALRPGGALCILNLSVRCDMALDRADAAGWAAASGMRLVRDGGRPLQLWDGTAFVFRR